MTKSVKPEPNQMRGNCDKTVTVNVCISVLAYGPSPRMSHVVVLLRRSSDPELDLELFL